MRIQLTNITSKKESLLIDLLDLHYEKLREGTPFPPPSLWCCQGTTGINLKSAIRALDSLPPPFKIKGIFCDGTKTITLSDKYNEKRGDYLAQPYAAKKYKDYIPTGKGIEDCYRALYLYDNPNSKIEVACPVGIIDCINETEIVEFKNSKYWKEGLGQLLSYSVYFPEKKRKLSLFGNTNTSSVEIKKVAAALDVIVEFN